MEYKSETKTCQNCQKDFTIEPEDFNFYEKIKVPPPTFCPECRFQRRMSWRNEKYLYKRNCDLCKKSIISIYPDEAIFPVYCKECWYSDKWDAMSYGRDYDFNKPFFEQWKELSLVVPRISLFQRNSINCDYSNMVGESKNVYLSVSVVLGSENIFYSKSVDKSFNIFDSYNIKESHSCYETIEGEKNYNCQNILLSKNCLDSYFLIDCVNCSNCALSSNLRNKEFYFRNKKLSKQDYLREIEKLNLGNRDSRELAIREFNEICKKAIYRFANISKSVDSTGNNLSNVKNAIKCFDAYNVEQAKYCYRILNCKDFMDVDYAGKGELMYEYNTGALNDCNIKFSYSAFTSVQNADYVESCISGSNLFGCISVKSRNNVILNKKYSKEEFEDLRGKIIKHMMKFPYIDKKGRVYKYGEFFPIELSAFAYNESQAQDLIPLTKKEIQVDGYRYKEPEIKNYNITLEVDLIPKDIKEVDVEILGEVLGCAHKEKCNHHCTKVFKLTEDEFNFYKNHNIPIPDKCSNCRFYERFSRILLPKLWHRKCMKEGCNNEFETSYSPDRPEIVYCEKCYQQEVY